MNERIEELMPTPWAFPYPDKEMYSKEQMVHFAGLIVKECCQMNYDFLESYREACEINERVHAHFGFNGNR